MQTVEEGKYSIYQRRVDQGKETLNNSVGRCLKLKTWLWMLLLSPEGGGHR